MNRTTRFILSIIFLTVAIAVNAQIKGVILDAENGDTISYASALYKGHHIATSCDSHGMFSIARHNGMTLTFSAIGYKSQTIKVSSQTPGFLTIKLKEDTKQLAEVKVTHKKQKYSRKENPAVELMKRVIAKKMETKLENKDYYQYRTYEKTTVALNEISEKSQQSGIISKKEWMKHQLEVNPITGKTVMPVIVNEKIFQTYYRRDPEKERINVEAEKSYGVTDLIETGDVFTTTIKDIFTEVDIYDDQMRLLQYPFTSPISKDAIGFYRFYITDTCEVSGDSCIAVSFMPNNQQDIGFRGDLWIVKDSSLQVKKVHLSLPQRSDVNFVHNMSIDQEYLHLPSGEWVLNVNDMLVELTIVGKAGNFLITQKARRNDYSFDPIDPVILKGKAKTKFDPYCQMRTKDYWTDAREVPLTSGEAGMDNFVKGIKSIKGFGWLMVGLKAVMENYIETTKQGHPSKFDIGPFTSTVSRNDIDGFRLRASGQTTAALNPHFFMKGYIAHGFSTHKHNPDAGNNYYNGTIIYSFNEKQYDAEEFPKKNISFSSTYDICSPADRFLNVDKDNIFAVAKWATQDKMAFYHQHKLDFDFEQDWGFEVKGGFKYEQEKAASYYGDPLRDWNFHRYGADGELMEYADGDLGKFTTSEVYLQLLYSPGQTYVNTKQKRIAINRDAPIFSLKHTIGFKGLFGGDYNYHVTEASIYKRFWLKSWGKLDVRVNGGMQWSKVPFPLLIAPASNLAYIWVPGTFELINNMEFLNDKYVSTMIEWDANGKIFNRIPLLKKLQWRELFAVDVLYGGLSDKNNPTLTASREGLMEFPDGCSPMNTHKPYVEVRFGIHNIFKLLQVEYVRRLTYTTNADGSPKSFWRTNGIRFGFRMTF